MKRLLLSILLASMSTVAAQIPQVHQHPRLEYDLEVPAEDRALWATVDSGLQVSFGSVDELYLRNHVPILSRSEKLVRTVWRGERVNAQVLLWSREPVKEVRLELGEMRSESGVKIPDAAVRTHFVRYTLSDYPVGAVGFTCETKSEEIYLLPDVLDRIPVFEVPANSVRPIWITVDVPSDAMVGDYRTGLEVSEDRQVVASLDLTVRVQAGVVPEPDEWSFRLDLWQNPWAVAYYHGVKPWSDAHVALLRPHLERLANAGQKFITTYVCHSPWKDDTYVPDSTMVEWIRRKDGTFAFDYTVFDQYVELAHECGIVDAITAYTMLPWQHRVRYLDEAAGRYVWTKWSPGSKPFREFWMVFLQDFRKHLISKGWFEKTFIGINENPLEDSQVSIDLVKEHSEDWKITYAGNRHEELLGVMDDYSVIVNQPIAEETIRKRRKLGQTTTFYVCCNPPKPNNFPFSLPAEGTWMGWYAFAHGYDGFLRWAYDSWTADPLRDTRHALWAAGDCFLAYPGGRSSIRFERLREGIVDFEKLRVVYKKLQELDNQESRDGLQQLDELLQRFSHERVQTEPAADTVNVAKALLVKLSELAF